MRPRAHILLLTATPGRGGGGQPVHMHPPSQACALRKHTQCVAFSHTQTFSGANYLICSFSICMAKVGIVEAPPPPRHPPVSLPRLRHANTQTPFQLPCLYLIYSFAKAVFQEEKRTPQGSTTALVNQTLRKDLVALLGRIRRCSVLTVACGV